ncbi:MAG: hypothetical protein AB7N76_32540 [Planctomycetota bacterium]
MSACSYDRSQDRERGATFTFVALAMAVLVLLSAGLLTDASQHTLIGAAERARRSALREGAFGGATWACKATAAELEQGTSLELMGCLVEVSPATRKGEGHELRCNATNAIGERFGLVCTIQAGQLTGFTRK